MKHVHRQGLAFLQHIIRISQDNYPEMLHKMIIVNAPWAFKMVFFPHGFYFPPLLFFKSFLMVCMDGCSRSHTRFLFFVVFHPFLTLSVRLSVSLWFQHVFLFSLVNLHLFF